MKIEIEKMWYAKATTVPVIVGALGMIKKGSDKHINKMLVMKYKKLHFVELLISFREY